MARMGRNLTRDLAIESRQHSLLGLDLGEGPSRRVLGFGALVVVIWCLLMWPLLRMPTAHTFSLYFLPPVILTLFGMRDGTPSRRRKITEWVLAVRYPFIGHKPLIKLGRTAPARGEFLPLSERWAFLGAVRQGIVPSSTAPAWADERAAQRPSRWLAKPTTKPIVLNQRGYLIGAATLYDRLTAGKKKVTTP